jgi:AAA family ATP:ADP antiporter
MKAKLLQLLDIEEDQVGRVIPLLLMGFFMGYFLATLSVGAQSLFLLRFDEATELPIALLISGAIGLTATILYNILQNRIPFQFLGSLSLLTITALTALIEFGDPFFESPDALYFLGFTLLIPCTYITYLIFWGTFTRLFNLRESKRLVGLVDFGGLFAAFLAFFTIPILLEPNGLFGFETGIETKSLFTHSLISIAIFLIMFLSLNKSLNRQMSFTEEKKSHRKIGIVEFSKIPYLLYLSLFVIVSVMALNFVDYSFLNVTTARFDEDRLASFISYFEMTIIIFSMAFQSLATDKLIKDYGLLVSILITPMLIGLFTLIALLVGSFFGYSPSDNFFVIFFLMIAISKLLIKSLKEALDNPTFKLYLLPIDQGIRIDAQTKIEGTISAFASLVAGACIYLITQVEIFDLLTITLFTIPLIALWIFAGYRMYKAYRDILNQALKKNQRHEGETKIKKVIHYNIQSVLEKEVSETKAEKVLYVLRLMEKLEPTLFEETLLKLVNNNATELQTFAKHKLASRSSLPSPIPTTLQHLANTAKERSSQHDVISITPEQLHLLAKSSKESERIIAAKLLLQNIDNKTIFILLELLRDSETSVRLEAIYTAKKTKRPETWSILIELLASPTYSQQAADALKACGEETLPVLENAFHKSGQQEIVLLRLVQIMARIGGKKAIELLWKKINYPDQRIVRQIIYAMRYSNYRVHGKQFSEITHLLEDEISKAAWNIAALHELPTSDEYTLLRQALEEEVKENHDQIFMLLSLQYNPESLRLVRENIDQGDPDRIAFALELLDVFIGPEIKRKLIALLDDTKTVEKLTKLQAFYPRDHYKAHDVINYILSRDYNQHNRWTKVCALYTTINLPDFEINSGLISHIFNPDKLLQETAAWILFQKNQALYEEIRERLPKQDKFFSDFSIANNNAQYPLHDNHFLWIEKVMFLKNLKAFHHIHGSLLSNVCDEISTMTIHEEQKIQFTSTESESTLFIVAKGTVEVLLEDQTLLTLKEGAILGEVFQPDAHYAIKEMIGRTPSILFKIPLAEFYFVLANHHELVEGLIQNIMLKDIAPIPDIID